MNAKSSIGILGAGTMGSGIAQLAAQHGHSVVVFDKKEGVLSSLRSRLQTVFASLVAKGSLTPTDAESALSRIVITSGLEGFGSCEMVVEAVIEELELKRQLLSSIEQNVSKTCLLATNTSSLSVTALAAACSAPERVLGAHFFNPAPVMKLVELIGGYRTSAETLERAELLLSSWNKTVIRVKDTPGFLVNRIARPFYGEAIRILEAQVADVATVDWALRTHGGFRMGPFELMDLIGVDVNLAVSEAVFRGFYFDARYRPSPLQQRMVWAGLLGRKTGAGFYRYGPDAEPPQPTTNEDLGQAIALRVVAVLINEACEALSQGVATASDIELAMTLGVNYPKGLFTWCNELGPEKVLQELEQLQDRYGEERYRPSHLLRKLVREGKHFDLN